ncbi:MAG TPA: hypothetical protein VHB27_22265 [Rhodopila sp.]|uniref:hypothetical protein n=1 Tax=Rhodopila sp. TaxID=2480087 RepID=UPI002BFDFE31|nr:hypothetical protein [Rhodopila sp.]HVY17960.1 hypothetical protein [Rhodopila sp.]
MSHTFILAPFVFAFLCFILRFYARENAASMANPSFLLAAATVIIAVAFLSLGVLSLLPPYSSIVVGVIGLGLAIVGGVRMFLI